MLPLEGIKVLDLSRLLPGAFCSLMLADFGAEVIKIEDTEKGDYSRWVHPMLSDTMLEETISAYFAVLNRNKKSIKLNLKTKQGTEVFLKLAESADIVLESFRPGVMDRLGIGYTKLKEINPRLIYCALTGYGQNGPYKNLPGHDINFLAIAGILGMQGIRDGPPILSGVQIADIGGGTLMALSGILLALIAREKTGKGQFVDIAMLDGAISWLAQHAGNYFGNHIEPQRSKMNLNGGYACYNIYEAKDHKYLALGALEEKFWAEFCKAINREDLIEKQYLEEEQLKIIEELQAIFHQKTSAEWLEYLKSYDTCITSINTLGEALSDPQVIHRNMVTKIRDPHTGKEMYQLGNPIKLSETPATLRSAPPRYGEHTVEILTSLGYTENEIQKMLQEGVC